MKLSGNTILITGGGSGIGLELARAFHDRKNKVIICGRNRRRLDDALITMPMAHGYRCDINVIEDIKKLKQALSSNHPELNILINNAGIQYNYSFAAPEDHGQRIDHEIHTNFLSQVRLTDQMIPHLIKQASSAIINVTSALALVPKQSAPVYCATKAALSSFTKALRYQLEGSSIKVFEIIPAIVDTEMTKGRGKNKLSPRALAVEALNAIEKDIYEIRIDKAKLLFAIHRILPGVAMKQIRHN